MTETSIVVRKKENGVGNKAIDTDFVSPCNYEEADTCMFLHAKHTALSCIRSINIVSSDTDVVIGVVVFDDLKVDELWMSYG